ncbi:MAG TPA: GNAT family N-acetyltransferase [Thermoleophilaceae bacterium]|nr:GNAT family N-acetyltransferase [Thermoleophilaceae bacterium]
MSAGAMTDLSFREGRAGDLRATFELGEAAWDASRRARGLMSPEHRRAASEVAEQWRSERAFIEFVAAQPDGSFWICEDGDELVGYTRVTRFGSMDELTELWVTPPYAGRGVGRALLERCWPESPTPELGRIVLTLGTPVDLNLYTDFGVMPMSGHWHMRHRVEEYLERRSQELDATGPGVHMLTPERAVEEWKRLEPLAVGHERPLLHDFFGRTRVCLAVVDPHTGRASALCWVSSAGEIGPAVGEGPEDLVPVVLAALDRVAKTHEPETFGVFCTTDSWWLLDRLRRLGFRVHWPAWVMSSVPLPGLDRYLATRPARLL